MPDAMTLLVAIALVVVAGLLVAVLIRMGSPAGARDAAAREAMEIRTRLEVLKAATSDFERDLRQDLANARSEQAAAAQAVRTELGGRLADLTRSNEQRLEAVRATVEQRLDVLRHENAEKLDQMRATVDEKLQTTLDERLGQSFKQVSDRLEQVHKGLGEMQSLADGVGDLKRVLSNVKRRGTWGEMQLGALLSEMLVPGQYGINVETVPGTGRRVEFALRMPGRTDEPACWIPIDAKFPVEEWERLQEAQERADAGAAEAARKALAGFLRQQARTVRENYVSPPHTSDFAFLYLPTESLYAEMMARPGLADELQREHRVMIAGPSNFLALLNIVQLGFRSVAIEQRSSEVWRTLGAVRTEFGKFGDVLARAQKKLQEASNTIEEARGKTTTIARKLRDVEGLPDNEADRLLSGSGESGRLFDENDADPPPGQPLPDSRHPGPMWSAISRWRQRRILSRTAIPEALWREATALRPFLAIYDADELSRLREKVVLFLHAKAIVGARGHEVTPLQRVVIAIEACVLVLELDMAFYDDFENVIVYPGEFVPDWEWEDEAGVVHRNDEPMAGEAMPGGPVVLSWPDVAASADWESTGMNLVIHEFAHKIDMRRGEADGCPPLPAAMSQDAWNEALTSAYEDFCDRVDRRESTDIDEYAAESPAEFFAVLSEVFFADPHLFRREYQRLYEQFVRFYRQDPAARNPPGG